MMKLVVSGKSTKSDGSRAINGATPSSCTSLQSEEGEQSSIEESGNEELGSLSGFEFESDFDTPRRPLQAIEYPGN